MGVNEQKMREALQECVNGLDDVMLELGYDALRPEFARACESLRKGRNALTTQTVFESVGWQFFEDGKWWIGTDYNKHRENTEAAGFPVRDIYALAQQPAAVVELTDDDVIRFAQTVKFKGRFVEAMREVLAFAKQGGM